MILFPFLNYFPIRSSMMLIMINLIQNVNYFFSMITLTFWNLMSGLYGRQGTRYDHPYPSISMGGNRAGSINLLPSVQQIFKILIFKLFCLGNNSLGLQSQACIINASYTHRTMAKERRWLRSPYWNHCRESSDIHSFIQMEGGS